MMRQGSNIKGRRGIKKEVMERRRRRWGGEGKRRSRGHLILAGAFSFSLHGRRGEHNRSATGRMKKRRIQLSSLSHPTVTSIRFDPGVGCVCMILL